MIYILFGNGEEFKFITYLQTLEPRIENKHLCTSYYIFYLRLSFMITKRKALMSANM